MTCRGICAKYRAQDLKRGVVTMLDKKDVRNVDYLSFVMI